MRLFLKRYYKHFETFKQIKYINRKKEKQKSFMCVLTYENSFPYKNRTPTEKKFK